MVDAINVLNVPVIDKIVDDPEISTRIVQQEWRLKCKPVCRNSWMSKRKGRGRWNFMVANLATARLRRIVYWRGGLRERGVRFYPALSQAIVDQAAV